jgi:chorismate mutase
VDLDDSACIKAAVQELLIEMVRANGVETVDLTAALFSVTPDLTAAYAASAARELGWTMVPLLDSVAPAVQGSPAMCVRVMLLWNTGRPQAAVRHIYLRGAKGLRSDLSPGGN